MKIKDGIDLDTLLKYGFEKPNKEEFDTLRFYDYIFTIGHSRRGQYYYLLISQSRSILIYASEADGDGGVIELPDILVKLISDGVVEIGENETKNNQ